MEGQRFNAYFPCQLQCISFNVTSENLVVHQPNALSRFSSPHHNVLLIRLRRNWMLVSFKYSHTKKGENLHINVEISYDNFVTATSRQFFIEEFKDIMSSSQFLDDHGCPQTEELQRKISAVAIIFRVNK